MTTVLLLSSTNDSLYSVAASKARHQSALEMFFESYTTAIKSSRMRTGGHSQMTWLWQSLPLSQPTFTRWLYKLPLHDYANITNCCCCCSFGQGSSQLWTHTRRPLYSRPIAL